MSCIDPGAELVVGFREAMSRLACGVSLITTRSAEGRPLGMLATAVSSVTADPPTLLVCINRSASIHAELRANGIFGVNFLGQRNHDLARRFASSEARESRFQTDDWRTAVTGAPLLGDALAVLDCRLDQVVEAGTHDVIFGRIEAIQLAPTVAESPLVYFGRSYSGLCEFGTPGSATV